MSTHGLIETARQELLAGGVITGEIHQAATGAARREIPSRLNRGLRPLR